MVVKKTKAGVEGTKPAFGKGAKFTPRSKAVHLGAEGLVLMSIVGASSEKKKSGPGYNLAIKLASLEAKSKGKQLVWFGQITGRPPRWSDKTVTNMDLTFQKVAIGLSKKGTDEEVAEIVQKLGSLEEKALYAFLKEKGKKIAVNVYDEEIMSGDDFSEPTGRAMSKIPLKDPFAPLDSYDPEAQIPSDGKIGGAPAKKSKKSKDAKDVDETDDDDADDEVSGLTETDEDEDDEEEDDEEEIEEEEEEEDDDED